MELKEIQDLIKFVAKTGVSEVELETKGIKLTIKAKEERSEPTFIQAQVPMAAPQPVAVAAPPVAATPNPAPAAPVESSSSTEDDSKYITIKSPMIGTFYRRPSPDKDLFVNVGDEIKPGQVTCIIEAMKLFNEIESEVSGKIVKILVDDQTPVEYDQPLFLVDPS